MKKNFTLNKYLCERKGLLVAFAFVTTIVAVAAPLKSYILQWLIDSQSQEEAVRYLLLGIAIVLVSHVAEYLSRRTFNHMAVRGITKARERLMQCYARKPLGVALSEPTGDTLSMLTNDLRSLMDDYYMGIFSIALWGGMGLVAAVMIARISPILLLVNLIFGALPLLVPKLLSKKLTGARSALSKQLAAYTGKAGELLKGYEALVGANGISYFLQSHRAASSQVNDREADTREAMAQASVLTSLAAWLPSIAILTAGLFLVFHGKMTIGTLVTANSLTSFIIGPLRSVSTAMVNLHSCLGIRKRIESAMNPPEETAGEEIAETVTPIQLSHVSFTYPNAEKPALRDVNFTIQAGEKVALIGASGSGKSTLAKLLYRYYDGYSGSISVGEQELSALSPESYRRRVAMIPQSPFVFSDTLYNNLCLYEKFTDSEVQTAISRAGLGDFVAQLPHGLQTELSENGGNLSGGQIQRIALARALPRRSEVILVDETTSSLDAATTSEIMAQLLSLPATVLVITHDTFGEYMHEFDRVVEVRDGVVI